MAVNKVVYGETTVIDITDSTVNANNLLSGNKAYGADGEPVFGSLSVGSTINVTTTDSELFGETLTLSDGTITLTTAFDNSGDATFTSVILIGTLTLSCGGFSMTISVPSYNTYNVEFVTVPQGSTVTPTDDIQTWLACANITDKSYTTLAEVLADRETFETLISDSNACDYMARSTEWAGDPTVKVPTMTNYTTPSGVVGYSSVYSGFPWWWAFDGNISVEHDGMISGTSGYVSYQFTKSVKVNKVSFYNRTGVGGIKDFTVDYYDGADWQTVYEGSATQESSKVKQEFAFDNDISSTTWRINILNGHGATNALGFNGCQFTYEGATTSKDAMALIGKYDYCSNALLGNATWREAICNSDYFEEVLNVKVPVMTSNTTPSGECIRSSIYGSSWEAWLAFDNNSSTRWNGDNSVSTAYIGYEFTKPVCINKVTFYPFYNAGGSYVKDYIVQGSNDNFVNDIHDLYSGTHSNTDTTESITFYNNTKYKDYRVYFSTTYRDGYSLWELQFYGRASKEVLVPLVPTMTSDTTPSGVASADSVYVTGYEAYRAFDNASSTTDAWLSGSTASSYNFPHWIQYQFPTAQVVGGLHFKNYSTGSYGVKTFKVQGSNDGTTWTDLYSGTGTNAGGGTLQEFYFDNTTAYLYYRLYITEGHSAIQCGICYLQFLRTQSLTNIIHSSANDTIYYYENGSPIIIATTNSSGIGICDFSLLDDKVYTLYSTVAKDPSNLSNPYSKQVRITNTTCGCTTELYVMPDTVKTLYWWGHKSDNLYEINSINGYSYSTGTLIAPTYNTNNIFFNGNGNSKGSGVGTLDKLVSGTICKSIQEATLLNGGWGTYITAKEAKNLGDAQSTIAMTGTNTLNQITLLSITLSKDCYVWCDSHHNRAGYCYAFWYE